MYIKEVRELGFRIQELISESLGLEKDYLKNALRDQAQHMAVNYYPECPEPEMTYGLPGHTDPNALTILLQDLHVSGLQILKDGIWLAVKPQPDAFVINIGDQLQVIIFLSICLSVFFFLSICFFTVSNLHILLTNYCTITRIIMAYRFLAYLLFCRL